ncbi:MAG: hypothetical protein ABJB55_07150 [Actinomycetota bacterium]
MPRILRLAVALAITAPALVSMAGPAVACSCAPLPAAKVLAQADAVVAGHVIGEQPIEAMITDSTLAVDGVYKGKVDATITLTANIGPGGVNSCAVLYPVGSKVDPLVLHRLDDGTYQIALCTFLSRAQVINLVGNARPPPPTQETPSASASPLPAADGDVGVSRPAVAAGIVLAVLAIALLLRWSGRRKRRVDLTPVQRIQRAARDGTSG